MSDKIHGFPEGAHKAKVAAHVANIPDRKSTGVVPAPGATPHMHGYGEVTSGTKGHPLTD